MVSSVKYLLIADNLLYFALGPIVYRLGHSLLKAGSAVRFCVGSQKRVFKKTELLQSFSLL